MQLKRIAGALGAELSGIDLRQPLHPDAAAQVRQALLDHGVIFLRRQPLTPEQFLAFARAMGEPVEYPFVKGLEGYPHIIEVKKLEHEKLNFGGIWHSDTTYLQEPPMGSMLLAREVPPYGGDTLFASQYAAWDALSPTMKRLLDGLQGISSSAKADVSKTREDRIKEGGTLPSRPHAPRDRPQGAVRERGAHRRHRRHDRRRKRAAAGVLVCAPGEAGVHLPLRVGARFHRVLGQPLRAAQPGE
jgi:taurine dioxygenase